MSANPRRLPSSGAFWIPHPDETDIEWSRYEVIAANELGGTEEVHFSDDSKNRIIEVLYDILRRDDGYKIETVKKQSKAIFEIVKGGLPDHILLSGRDQFTPSDFLRDQPMFHEGVFTQMMVSTLDEAAAGRSVKERVQIYRQILRNDPDALTIKSPRSEAMSVKIIQEAFIASGMSAKVTHTRPTSSGEGNEVLSAFEQFIFEFVLTDIGSDDSARKVLYRRLKEAERAI